MVGIGVDVESFVVGLSVWIVGSVRVVEILNNVTRNTNFLFGTETIQTARNYQNISEHSKTKMFIIE